MNRGRIGKVSELNRGRIGKVSESERVGNQIVSKSESVIIGKSKRWKYSARWKGSEFEN